MFQCMTLDSWSSIMYINLFGCDVIGYSDWPEWCVAPKANFLGSAIFFPMAVVSRPRSTSTPELTQLNQDFHPRPC